MKCSKFFVCLVLITGCRGAYTPFFELNTDEDTETVFESEIFTDMNSDIVTPDTDIIVQSSDIDTDTTTQLSSDEDTDEDSESDTVSDEDSESEHNSESETETETESSSTESISDSGEDSETVTSSDSMSDADTDTDTDSGENNTSDDITDCPGSCQYNRYTREEIEASDLINGFSIDPSVNSILICDDGTDGKGFETYPVYTGWIRDDSFECHGIGLYCCRPQTVYDLYCSETGGICVPSSQPGEGAGFCAFASNGCEEIES